MHAKKIDENIQIKYKKKKKYKKKTADFAKHLVRLKAARVRGQFLGLCCF